MPGDKVARVLWETTFKSWTVTMPSSTISSIFGSIRSNSGAGNDYRDANGYIVGENLDPSVEISPLS